MIAKNKKGKSFGGCVRYVLNEGCEILAAEGVLTENAASIIRDFAIQRSSRPEIKQPVGHIAVSFSPEDSARMTSDFMLKLAHEYMEAMNIRNTQYVIVRHLNTDHEHFHIVYNRIDNDLKLISVNNDYKRNVKVCKKLKDKYGLTYGKGKEKVNRPKLKGADKVKYQIHDQIAAILPKCIGYSDLEKRLAQGGITIQYKYRSGAEKCEENIQGISFRKDNYSFKGSEIDRKFSHANLKKVLSANLGEAWEKMKHMIMPEDEIKPKQAMTHVTMSPKPQVSEPFQPQEQQLHGTSRPLAQQQSAPQVPQIQQSMPRKMQKFELSNPSVSEAPEQQEQPCPVKRYPTVFGVEVTAEQDKTLRSGGHIYLENMERKDGSGKFSAFVFLDDEMKRVFHSAENPDDMVKYGGATIRQRDKIQVENGEVVKAKMKWWGGIDFQYPFVWKDSKTNEIKHSFADPRIPKEQQEKEMREFDKRIRRNIPPPKKKGPSLG